MSLWRYVDTSGGPTACWPWTGSIGTSGYGRIRVGSRIRDAHRVIYELTYGPIAPGLVVRHLCVERSTQRIPGGPHAERACCNPAHLEAGTQQQNAHDRERHARTRSRRTQRWWWWP